MRHTCASAEGRDQWKEGFKPFLRAAPVRVAMMVAMIIYLAMVPGSQAQQFIYFQF